MCACVRACVRVCVRVMSSLWPEIKNSVTRPDDLLRKLKGVDVWSKRDSDGKRDRKRKGERYREDTLPLSFTSQCRIKQIKLFSFFFLCLFSIFFFFWFFPSPAYSTTMTTTTVSLRLRTLIVT